MKMCNVTYRIVFLLIFYFRRKKTKFLSKLAKYIYILKHTKSLYKYHKYIHNVLI